MSIRIHCAACGTQHSVHDRLAGRSIRCPTCDALIDVAQQPDPSAEDLVESVELVNEPEVVEGVELVDEDNDVIDVVEVVEDDGNSGIEDGPNTVDDDDEEIQEITFPKKELPKDDMDMTPMVDVTFLLLIFFMITASFSSEKVIEEPPSMSDRAAQQQKEEPDKILDTVRVQVDEFNAYTIILPGGEDRQASSKQDLLIALDDARREIVTGANDEVLKMAVEAHVDSIHAAVIAALDAGRDKGFSSFQVTVVEEFD